MTSPKKSVVITVDDAHLPQIAQVAEQLRSRGLDVQEVMEATGMISGELTAETASLESVPGVTSVEEQPQFQLPPPESPLQ